MAQGLTTPHHSLAFNKTVDIIEKPKLIDFELIGLYGIFAAIIAGVGESRRSTLHGIVLPDPLSDVCRRLHIVMCLVMGVQGLHLVARQWAVSLSHHAAD